MVKRVDVYHAGSDVSKDLTVSSPWFLLEVETKSLIDTTHTESVFSLFVIRL